MIDRSEFSAVAAQFGAPDSQVIRGHLISHLLAAIAEWPGADGVTFFGGTALCRTWLPDLRLSEDIDLLLNTPTEGEDLRRHVSRRLRREFPNLEWTRLGSQHQVETWTLTTDQLDRYALDQVRHIAGFTPDSATLEQRVLRTVKAAWQAEPGHQLADALTAAQCLARVRLALDRLNPES